MTLSNEFFVGLDGGNASPTYLNQQRIRTAGGPFMAQLGQYQFSLETAAFDQLKRATEYLWKGQNRIGRRPAQQFLGMGEETITLQGTIYPHFRGGLGQLDTMRAAAGRGEPLALIYAFETAGQYAGRWCIRSISDERSVPMRNGAARKIDFALTLVAYGEDDENNAAVTQQGKAADASPAALQAPAMTGDSAADLKANSLDVDGLPDVIDDEWSTEE
jgi:hypothetical protein